MKPLLYLLATLTAVALAASEKSNLEPREHWAFKPPVRSPVPSGSTIQSPNPIDGFLAAEWEKRGLKPSPPATKDVLLRRVYLDLIGLPPTREELHSFREDTSPNAYRKVVDRLLASPQYGERWARHWMDVWRYADWYGRRHVPDVWNSAPQVWRWRDWIVRSLNADKGYDRMLIEMLAADEVEPENDQARVATGYLVRNWYALNPNQWMRDIVEHTGKAFLGLTFNCAHCHDHKYDPITQRDYFQFRAFFEPLQVRQDRVSDEPDPGPFQKYEYSVTRKVVTNGMATVFDENLDAKTFIYLRGDERSFPEDKPTVAPAVPAFAGGDSLKVEHIDLPPTAYYPGLKPPLQQAEISKREQALAGAKEAMAAALRARAQVKVTEGALTNAAKVFADFLRLEADVRSKSNQVVIAQAELDAIRARIDADKARFSDDTSDLAVIASRAERRVSLAKAQGKLTDAKSALSLLEAEQSLAATRHSTTGTELKKEDKDKAEGVLKKAQEQLASAQKAVETAEAALHTNSNAYTPLAPLYPAQSSGRRKALADWIASPTNPLTARVAVNHIWARHFHAPLVASMYDFGRNGAQPTHPELLDWLAVEFVENGWSMKHLHRLLVTSSAYRMASGGVGVMENSDPENRYLWHMNSGQMEAEVLRDSILHIAGELDLRPVGYPLANADAEKLHRRSLYFECFPEPKGQSEFAELFDAPNPMECYRRTQTIVPQQALALANSKLSNERSRALAQRLAGTLAETNEMSFITGAYEQILNRRPTDRELTASHDFLTRQANGTNILSARSSLVHVLFNHNDFVAIR